MRTITLDFETYYSKEYSLSKMTTEAYIKDKRFQIIGFSYAIDEAPAIWVSGDDEHLSSALYNLKLEDSKLVAHNAMFDCGILATRYAIHPRLIIDTMSMARPIQSMTGGNSLANLVKFFGLGEKGTEVVNALGKRREDFTPDELARYGGYCDNDVELTRKLLQALLPYSTPQEMYVIDMLLRLYTDPVLELNTSILNRHLLEVQGRKERLLDKVEAVVGKDGLMSNTQFADLLVRLGVSPPMKLSKTTNKETFAFAKTDPGLKELLEHPDERVQAVVAARMGVKSTIEESRTLSFLDVASRGALPIALNYYGAHTGRCSGAEKLNLQNLPRGGALRKAVQAPEGHTVIACDSAQIEARVVAWLAGAVELVESFRKGKDVYSEFATSVYGTTITKENKTERHVGKTCIAEGTLVLCSTGWKPIERVSVDDLLWDGEEWVCQKGLVLNGWKQTLNIYGTWLTPDHHLLSGTQWLEAQYLVRDESTLSQALATAAANLPLQATYLAQGVEQSQLLSSAAAAFQNIQLRITTSKTSRLLGVISAQSKHLRKSVIGNTQLLWAMTPIVRGYLTGYRQQLQGVITPKVGTLNTMGSAAYMYATCGDSIEQRSYPMSRRLMGGINQSLKWIESIITAATHRGILGLFRGAITYAIAGNWKTLKRRLRVYDIACCGPRNRFTILTQQGPLIAHNCILGLGFEMGAARFREQLKASNPSVIVDETEAKRIVDLYRAKYYKIKELWKAADAAMRIVAAGGVAEFGVGISLRWDHEGIHLPNGMVLYYPNLRWSAEAQDGKGAYVYDSRYGDNTLYSGKIIENVVQALARIIVFYQTCKIDQKLRKVDRPGARFKLVISVHDEAVVVVPTVAAKKTEEMMLRIMSEPPAWAPDLPIACEAHGGDNYADCK